MDKEKEMTEWLRLLLDYAEGRKKWDTGGIWVCEKHPLLPFEQGLTFDCACGGPGMPPFIPLEIDPILKKNLYLALEKNQKNLKEWFIGEAEAFISYLYLVNQSDREY